MHETVVSIECSNGPHLNCSPAKLMAMLQARRLYRLSEWLQKNGDRGAIPGRLNDDEPARDVGQYKDQTADTKINADLLRLRRYQQVLEANRALGLPFPEGARPLAGEGAWQSSWPQEFPSTPATPSAGAWACLGSRCKNLRHHRLQGVRPQIFTAVLSR